MPGPVSVMSEEIFGSTLVKVIGPVKPVRSMLSEPSLFPAAHSPATAPDAALVFAAMIASRKVHASSALFATSEVLLTVIVLPAALTVSFVISDAKTSEVVQMKAKTSTRMRE